MILLATVLAAGLATASPAPPPPPSDDALVLQLTDKTTRDAARSALALRGAGAVPTLIAHAHDEDGQVRWEIANLLGAAADERGAPALADLALHETNSHIRWRALWALSRSTTNDKAIVAMRKGMQEASAETK